MNTNNKWKTNKWFGIIGCVCLISMGVGFNFTVSEVEDNYNKISYLNYVMEYNSSDFFKDADKEYVLEVIYSYIEVELDKPVNDTVKTDLSSLINNENPDLFISKYLFDLHNSESISSEKVMENLKTYNGLDREKLATEIYDTVGSKDKWLYNNILINVKESLL